MYPNKKYMDSTNSNDIKFTPLSSEILNQIYNPIKDVNFYTPLIMKKPFDEHTQLLRNSKQNQAYIRFLNTVHSNYKINIYINSQLIKKDIQYSTMTSYITIPNGNYTIRIYKSEITDNPLLIYNIKLNNASHYTLSIIEVNNKLKIVPLNDMDKPGNASNTKDSIYVRFINLIPFSPLLNVTINDEELIINNVEYAESTNYINLPPNTYSFEIFPNDKSLKRIVIPKVSLVPGTYYTIFAVGRSDLPGSHKALLYKDA